MSASFVVLFWAILLFPVGLLLGYFFRGKPKEKQAGCGCLSCSSLLFAGLFVIVMCGLGIYVTEKDNDNYWESQGAWDFYRMPLEEPYELRTIFSDQHSMDIGKWKDGGNVVWDITEYEKRGSLIAGRGQNGYSYRSGKNWFLFDCDTGQADMYESKEALEEACGQKGFPLPLSMKSVSENWDAYWSDPNRRRK